MEKIPFNRPHLTSRELDYVRHAHELGQFSGDGHYTKLCNRWFEENYERKTLLTHSCTAALEMMAILSGIGPGDEVIMPSYTFVSTANAIVLRGGVPVFVDIDAQTLNIDVSKIEPAITNRTKAVMVVHYAGFACDMDAVFEICSRHQLILLEDAAQGFHSRYKGRLLGTIGQLGALSFHETKNVISGEGGALVINDAGLAERAEIIREKGTNRSLFFRGQVDKYTWVDVGSSYLPGEVIAAFLFAQLEHAGDITRRRLEIWARYHEKLKHLEDQGRIVRPKVPENVEPNGHMYFLLLPDLERRTRFIDAMKAHQVSTVFHYIPLHSSPAGRRFAKTSGDLSVTDDVSDRLVRLPLYYDLTDVQVDAIVDLVERFFRSLT